jgi:flagellar motor component MotA
MDFATLIGIVSGFAPIIISIMMGGGRSGASSMRRGSPW